MRVNLGEIICDSEFGDPSLSEYILPFEVGEEFLIIQGNCPPNPNWGHHNTFAYDFDMQIGDQIIASRAGTVIFTQNDKPDNVLNCGGGTANWIFIEHEDGTVMQYVHLMQGGVQVNVGQEVEQGETLGLSGNSGCSSGPHLHTNLFRDRTNFDRQSSLPFNYSNAEGKLDGNNGLIGEETYRALPF